MILYSSWLKLPLSTRNKVAEKFKLSKTGPTHVFGKDVIQDGYDLKNIEGALTVDNMQKFLNSTETNPEALFRLVVDTVEGRIQIQQPVVETITVDNNVDKPVEKEVLPVVKKTRNAKTKKSKQE